MSHSFPPLGLSLALLLTAPACGGHIILGAPDSGVPANTNVCASDNDCVGGEPGSCQAGRCTTPGEDGGSVSSSPPPNGPFPECPGTKPETGSACSTPNQGCAYVDITAGTCESWTCDSKGEWESSTPAGC
jgi:hypothetical protein